MWAADPLVGDPENPQNPDVQHWMRLIRNGKPIEACIGPNGYAYLILGAGLRPSPIQLRPRPSYPLERMHGAAPNWPSRTGIAPAAGNACFPADTPVATKGGLKPIQHVRADDLVWGYDLSACEWVLRRVVETYAHDFDGEIVAATVAGEVVEATANHPFWVVEGDGLAGRNHSDHVPETTPDSRTPGRWADAGDLRVGDVLLLKPGKRAAITRLTVRQARQPVYNFQVEGVHTYAVGTAQVLVHNKPVPANFPPLTPADFAGVKVPTAVPFKPANPAAVVNSLPEFVAGQQGRVFGILVVDGKAYYLRSGISEATETVGGQVFHAGVARDAPFNFSGSQYGLREHVEGAAASIMYKLEAKEATLYLNAIPCGIRGEVGCWNNLPFMIPQGSKIKVFYPTRMGGRDVIVDMLVPAQ